MGNQDATIGAHHDEVAHVADDDGLIIAPDDAVARVMQRYRPDGDIAPGVGGATYATSAIASGLVVLAAVGVVLLGLLVGLRHWVVRLDETGYRVRVLRTAEARSARWADVLDLQTGTVQGSRSVVLRLRDGRTTALPVDALEGGATGLTEALTSHLDRGHGYRRLR